MRISIAMVLVAIVLPLGSLARKKELSEVRRVVRGFSAIDTNYIEPQHYNFTVMLQSTFNYDMYRLKSGGQSVMFSPDVTTKVGPYVGWRWFFLGYTFDLKNLTLGSKQKREIDFSIYSSQIGVDLFYRRTGSDYKIRRVTTSSTGETTEMENVSFDGLNVGITGLNLYYIFNHNRFSYPAAFSQSTCQKISCGSWMAGIGYTHHTLDLDYERLKTTVERNMPSGDMELDSGLMVTDVSYTDVNVSCGYAYNWVFAKNCLFCASLQGALGYKHSGGDSDGDSGLRSFDFSNFNIDGVGRFGVVYNNTRWYTGLSAIVRTYNYSKSRFETNNIFGSVNVYIGYNFGLKKGYRKKNDK